MVGTWNAQQTGTASGNSRQEACGCLHRGETDGRARSSHRSQLSSHRKRSMKTLIFLALIGIAAARPLAAAGPAEKSGLSHDSIVLTTSVDGYKPGGFGSNGSFDWVHDSGGGAVYTLGLSIFSAPSEHWSFARIGALHSFTRKISIQGNAS